MKVTRESIEFTMWMQLLAAFFAWIFAGPAMAIGIVIGTIFTLLILIDNQQKS